MVLPHTYPKIRRIRGKKGKQILLVMRLDKSGCVQEAKVKATLGFLTLIFSQQSKMTKQIIKLKYDRIF